MTGIKIVCVGRVKEDFFRDGIAAYVKEIRKKYSMDIMECPDEPTPDQCPASVERQIREMEGERILSKIKDDDYVIKFLTIDKDCDIIIIGNEGTVKINTKEISLVSKNALGVKGTNQEITNLLKVKS